MSFPRKPGPKLHRLSQGLGGEKTGCVDTLVGGAVARCNHWLGEISHGVPKGSLVTSYSLRVKELIGKQAGWFAG